MAIVLCFSTLGLSPQGNCFIQQHKADIINRQVLNLANPLPVMFSGLKLWTRLEYQVDISLWIAMQLVSVVPFQLSVVDINDI